MNEPLFIPASFFFIRSPLWTIEDCKYMFEHDQWVDKIFNLYEKEGLLREAIAIASPSLHSALQKKNFQRTEAIASSLLNYALRSAT